MIKSGKYLWPLVGLVILIQTAALLKIVRDRDRLIKDGREITMSVVPVDPRDLMRGDYVILNYSLSPLRTEEIPGANLEGLSSGSVVYVTLAPGEGNRWKAVGASASPPEFTIPENVLVKARVQTIWHDESTKRTEAHVRYGIESYFVPEGTGKAIENKIRSGKVEALVAIGRDGTAALKGIVVDGHRFVDPPML